MKVSALILASVISFVYSKKEAPTTLQIGIKQKVDPEKCISAKKGGTTFGWALVLTDNFLDKLTMEYTGTLFSDGSKFDSSIGMLATIQWDNVHI